MPQQGEWLALLTLGGPVVLVLLFMSVVALAVSLFKFLQLSPYSKRSLDKLDDAITQWCQGDGNASDMVQANKSPLSGMVGEGMTWIADTTIDRAAIEAELTRKAQRVLERLSSLLGVLEQVAYLAPLLGLLGTVLGIIDVFHGLAEQGATADSGALAGGIWEALLTTAVGLCVAIPFAVLHSGFMGKVDTVRSRTEDMLTRLFTADLYRSGHGGDT
ncbi:MAG: MotA/TolQ/ExbB proton channel family protein [Pseudomonadota bacterium]